MSIRITYTWARAHLAQLLDEVVDNRETVVITRRGREDVAMIAATELSGIVETAYLFRSPRNAKRLLRSLESTRRGQGDKVSIEDLRRRFGLEEKE
ncbi:MAG: type II toxin-antitoxin system prevent-host-death family antitoxin [Acidobacteria bacterium]|nr:type II toxin-antitoxin system prevent-host-death family antitoxin [Acidobacteriota bacterium]